MTESELIEIMRSSVNELLRWVGFGTLTGLAAKAIMPGRDPGGAVSTLLIGIGGSVIGCGTALFFWRDAAIDPISFKGFFAAVFGAFTLLFFYRLLAGSLFREATEDDDRWMSRVRRRLRRRQVIDDVLRDAA
ncbi:MAG: GlsB/YeaQ/YmgE family stress response membrane protein [Planctomyces sp.]